MACYNNLSHKKKEASLLWGGGGDTDFSFADKDLHQKHFILYKNSTPWKSRKKKLHYSSLKIQKPIIENLIDSLTFFQISIQHLTSLTEMKCNIPSVLGLIQMQGVEVFF